MRFTCVLSSQVRSDLEGLVPGRAKLRIGMLRRRTPIGARARRRMDAGGPRAIGRWAASWADWAAIRDKILARAGWRCQACGVRRRLDVHHVIRRSQGGRTSTWIASWPSVDGVTSRQMHPTNGGVSS